ncbi:putative F-box/FBD/LRR-repeat protein At1g78760 isoform X2 [Tripterygium wilfordii]|uniref:putative F-box/FBD/LRR-repeat protein At1g78760 isoform X2 n=1 Tax=Tripterygium wilfordii TaxID=458696 RepID=UPI0018F7EA4D|nr:putative F-box/FBD/LRR-repeat protein At1g78760 isoform X2 [Tripterygium wilfordii]
MFKLITGRRWVERSVRAKKQEKREYDIEEDKLSGLPDEVLLSILSLLSLKEAARTSVLARRWRRVWTFIPILNFDASPALLALKERWRMVGSFDNKMLAVERDKYVDWVNLALEAYQGSSIDELRVRFDLDEIHSYDIDKWVYFAIEKKVKRLVMKFQKCMAYVYNEKVYSFPPLRDTFKTLHYCRSLIALELNCVNISGGVVEYFIASCPYLRQLSVKYSDSLADLKVSGESLCLEYLKIVRCNKLKSIYISAENLLSFVYSGPTIKISFANVPNLVELSFDRIYALRYLPQASNFAAQLVTLELKVLMPEVSILNYVFLVFVPLDFF